jgi:hypothetical protein
LWPPQWRRRQLFLGGQTSETYLVSIVIGPFNVLIVLVQVYSYLEFDLTLGVIPIV